MPKQMREEMSLIRQAIVFVMAILTCYSNVNQVSTKRVFRNSDENFDADFAPKFVEQPRNAFVELRKPHTFECNVEAKPAAQVAWFKDNAPVASLAQHVVQANNELMFLQFKHSDIGSYHCEANNYLGIAKSDEFSILPVTVQTDKLVAQLSRTQVLVNERVDISCSLLDASDLQALIKGYATLLWTKNGRPITYSTTQTELPQVGKPALEATARRVSENEFVLSTSARQSDNESSFTCQLIYHDNESTITLLSNDNINDNSQQTNNADSVEQIKESKQTQQLLVVATSSVELDANMGPPVENLVHSNPKVHANNNNNTSSINLFAPNKPTTTTTTTTTADTNAAHSDDWLLAVLIAGALAKLSDFGAPLIAACVVAAIIVAALLALLLPRDYSLSRKYKKYTKQEQQHYNSSAGSTSLQADQANVDPFLSSLMARTMSTASNNNNNSNSNNNNFGAISSPLLASIGKKLDRSCSGAVAATSTSAHSLLSRPQISSSNINLVSSSSSSSTSYNQSHTHINNNNNILCNSNKQTNSNNSDSVVVTINQLTNAPLSSTSQLLAAQHQQQQVLASNRQQRVKPTYMSYRGQMRKVAAANADVSDNDSTIISPYAVSTISGKLCEQQQQQHNQQQPSSSLLTQLRQLPPVLPQRPPTLMQAQHELHRRSASNSSNIAADNNNKQSQPPPMTADAMRALQEQFDINQLVSIEEQTVSTNSCNSQTPNYDDDDDDDFDDGYCRNNFSN